MLSSPDFSAFFTLSAFSENITLKFAYTNRYTVHCNAKQSRRGNKQRNPASVTVFHCNRKNCVQSSLLVLFSTLFGIAVYN